VVPHRGGQETTLVNGEEPYWATNSRTVVYARRRVTARPLCVTCSRNIKDVSESGRSSQPVGQIEKVRFTKNKK